MKGRPAYGIDVLNMEVVKAIEDSDISYKNYQDFIDKFKQLDIKEKKAIITEVFSIQSEYLFDAFANNQDNIYIPFLGAFKPRLKARVRKEFKAQNIEFTDEDVNEKAHALYKENVNKYHCVEEVGVVVSNLDEIFAKYRFNK